MLDTAAHQAATPEGVLHEQKIMCALLRAKNNVRTIAGFSYVWLIPLVAESHQRSSFVPSPNDTTSDTSPRATTFDSDAKQSVDLLFNLMANNIRSRDILTAEAFKNAIAVCAHVLL